MHYVIMALILYKELMLPEKDWFTVLLVVGTSIAIMCIPKSIEIFKKRLQRGYYKMKGRKAVIIMRVITAFLLIVVLYTQYLNTDARQVDINFVEADIDLGVDNAITKRMYAAPKVMKEIFVIIEEMKDSLIEYSEAAERVENESDKIALKQNVEEEVNEQKLEVEGLLAECRVFGILVMCILCLRVISKAVDSILDYKWMKSNKQQIVTEQ